MLAEISLLMQSVWIILKFEVFVQGKKGFNSWPESRTSTCVEQVNIVCNCYNRVHVHFCVSKLNVSHAKICPLSFSIYIPSWYYWYHLRMASGVAIFMTLLDLFL